MKKLSVKREVVETEISRSSGGNNNYVLLLLRVKSFLVGTVTSKNLRIFSFNHSWQNVKKPVNTILFLFDPLISILSKLQFVNNFGELQTFHPKCQKFGFRQFQNWHEHLHFSHIWKANFFLFVLFLKSLQFLGMTVLSILFKFISRTFLLITATIQFYFCCQKHYYVDVIVDGKLKVKMT